MQVKKILKRIGLDSSKKYMPTLETLQLLQKQYMLTVPYENLDFHLHKEFSTDLLKVFEKIVLNNRGGICYESHTLFLYLLQHIGYDAYWIFAKVDDLTYIGKDYPHLVILVHIDGIDYLVDVANGQNVREPMNMDDPNLISVAEDNQYKIEPIENTYTLLVHNKQQDWFPRYSFTKEQKHQSDFKDTFKNDYKNKEATNIPLLITLAKENGRVTMHNDIMIQKENNTRHSWHISDQNRAEVLKEYFNITLS